MNRRQAYPQALEQPCPLSHPLHSTVSHVPTTKTSEKTKFNRKKDGKRLIPLVDYLSIEVVQDYCPPTPNKPKKKKEEVVEQLGS